MHTCKPSGQVAIAEMYLPSLRRSVECAVILIVLVAFIIIEMGIEGTQREEAVDLLITIQVYITEIHHFVIILP